MRIFSHFSCLPVNNFSRMRERNVLYRSFLKCRFFSFLGVHMPRLTIFEGRGFDLDPQKFHRKPHGSGGKRSRLDGKKLSKASFVRFRDFCLHNHVPGTDIWGCTFTVPGLELMYPHTFKRLWHRMNYFANRFRIPIIWRVELQRRKMPHVHAVVFGSSADCLLLFDMWFSLLRSRVLGHVYIGDGISDVRRVERRWLHGASHAVDLERLEDNHRAFRYLVCHTGKRKEWQMGWAGRNWGVINRKMFRSVVPSQFTDLNDHDYYSVVRWLRRLTHSRVNGRLGCSSWICDPSTVRRMVDFLAKQVPF